MRLSFYRNGVVVNTIRPDQNSVQRLAVMGEDILALQFTSFPNLDFRYQDYCTMYGKKYKVNQLPVLTKSGERQHSYTLNVEGPQYDLGRVGLLLPGGNVPFTTYATAFTGTARDVAVLIQQNLDRVFPGVWAFDSIADTDTKTISFSGDNCLTALGKIFTTYGVEYYFQGYQINLNKKNANSGLTFSYGENKGLYNIQRNNVSGSGLITRLYAYGSTDNISNDYRQGAGILLLPAADAPHGYIEQNADTLGVYEAEISFDDIKPQHEGTVTAVDSPLQFKDSTLPFDLNAQGILIGGTAAKIVFNTGLCAGYTFTVTSYNDNTKTFVINVNTDEKDFTIPSAILSPAVGDKYFVEDISLPQTFVDEAEQKLLAKAADYLAQFNPPAYNYAIQIDSDYLKKQNQTIDLGSNIEVKEPDLNLDRQIRVNSYSRSLQNPFLYPQIELNDTPSANLVIKILDNQTSINNIIGFNKLSDPNKARFSWKNEIEYANSIFDPTGSIYTNKIYPLFVQTVGLLVGTDPGQFTLDGVDFDSNPGGDPTKFYTTAGVMHHETIDPTAVRSWAVSATQTTGLDTGKGYYVYVKAQRTGSAASIFTSTQKIIYDSDPTFYYFPVGFLSSVIDGVRGFTETYGFTAINGGFIRTDVIKGNGLIIDYRNGYIYGKVNFTNGSTGYNNIIDKPDLSVFAQQAYVAAAISGIQTQIDGQVDQYFYAYDPTLTNQPASDWNTDLIKNEHLDDLFYNIVNGYAYRFTLAAGVYGWTRLMDTDIIAALVNASKAQDTADDKRRVFLAQPTTPYDRGDMWTQGAAGDLKRCIVARQSGPYIASDWDLASKYTDDTAVINLQIGGRNLIVGNSNLQSLTGWGVNQSGNGGTGIIDYFGTSLAQIYSDSANQGLYRFLNLTVGQTYTVSGMVKAVNNSIITFGLNNELIKVFTVNISENWKKIQVTFTASLTTDYIVVYTADGVSNFLLNNIKLETGSKATDWTPAPEDVSAAISTAQNKANDAALAASNSQLSANAANTLLAQIASDNFFSPLEKQQALLEKNTIVSEYPIIQNQANSYGILHQDYDNSYNTLIGYLTPLLADINSGSDIDGPTFRDIFNLYYTSRTNLLKAISDLAKTLATNAQNTANAAGTAAAGAQNTANTANANAAIAQSAANNSQLSANAANALLADIASDNVLTASEKQATFLQYQNITGEYSTILAQANLYGVSTSSYTGQYNQLINYLQSGILADLQSSSPISGSDFRANFNNYYQARTSLLKAVSDVANALATNAQNTANTALVNANTAIANAQNALNVANAVSQVTTFLTTNINGNVVATGVLLVGDVSGANAFISGVTDQPNSQSVRFGAGATYQNKNVAPFRVLDDGSLYATKAFISGNITATSGVIGNWTITATGLINTNPSLASSVNLSQQDANGNSRQAYIGIDDLSGSNSTRLASFISNIPSSHTNIALYAEAKNGTFAAPDLNNYTGNIAGRFVGEVQMLSPENNQHYVVLNFPGTAANLRLIINGLPAAPTNANDLKNGFYALVVGKQSGQVHLANIYTGTATSV